MPGLKWGPYTEAPKIRPPGSRQNFAAISVTSTCFSVMRERLRYWRKRETISSSDAPYARVVIEIRKKIRRFIACLPNVRGEPHGQRAWRVLNSIVRFGLGFSLEIR